MIPENIKEKYEPFGYEWKKEVSKLPKSMLIEQWKKSCIKVQEKDEKIKELEEEINKPKMKGKLITYCGFTQSNRNHLTIEVWGTENFIGNSIKTGDEFELWHKNYF